MQPSSTVKTTSWTLFWVMVFIGSVSVVTTIRHRLASNRQFVNAAQTVSNEAVHLVKQSRHLLLP